MSYQQQRLFDGYNVVKEKAKFGTIEIEESDVEHFRASEGVVFVGYATVGGASFKPNSDGDWVRTNNLTVHQVHVASGVMRDEIVEFFNMAGDALPFATGGGTGGGTGGKAQAAPEDEEEGEPQVAGGTPAAPGADRQYDPALAQFLAQEA